MAGEVLHEEREELGPEVLDRHRAISTIMEELEAIDWYDQRIKASSNRELQAVLLHNRNEEKEHCSMVLEWLRRHDEEFNAYLRTYRSARDRSGRPAHRPKRPRRPAAAFRLAV
jgi:hypothetical protein